MTAAAPFGPASERGPVWTRAEIVLALRIAASTAAVDPNEPSRTVLELADLLTRAGRRAGRAMSGWSRSPRAVALKVLAIRRALADPSRLNPLGRTAVAVIEQFRGQPEQLMIEAVGAEAKLVEVEASPSRGPAPSEGQCVIDRCCTPNLVYALRLEGDVQALVHFKLAGRDLFKIGRTGDLERRIAQLNWGFPSKLTLRWVPFAASAAMSAGVAHQVEQELLSRFASLGWTVGGEFAMARPDRIAEVLDSAGIQTIMRPAAVASRVKAESVMPSGARQ